MKAITFTRYGSPDLLHLQEVPTPTPKDDEVLVKVHASSINSWDWEFQSGETLPSRLLLGVFKPRKVKRKLGCDVAGTVELIGDNVSQFKPGDEVFGDLWDNFGGFAEYACASENSLELKPETLTFKQAAAVPQAGVLAYQGLKMTGQIQSGQKVLINGAGGGVGTFAVQIAKLSGTEVTGVDYPHKLDVIKSLGADHIMDCTKEDFTRTGKRYDLILDVYANRSLLAYRRALTDAGVYAMVGATTLRIAQFLLLKPWTMLTNDSRKIRLVSEGPSKGLARISHGI